MSKTRLVMLYRLFFVASVLLWLVALSAVGKAGLVPRKYFWLGASVLFVLFVVLWFMSFKKSLRHKLAIVFLLSLYVLSIGTSIYVFSVSQKTKAFIESFQSKKEGVISSYQVVVKKGRSSEFNAKKSPSIGVLGTDIYITELSAQVAQTFLSQPQTFSNLTALTLALEDNTIDAVAIDNSYLLLLQENYKTFYDTVEVARVLQVTVPIVKAQKTVDITKPFVVYISGIDTYGEVSTVSRSDVNILVVINPITHKILLVNTPRDFYVQLHGTEGLRDKLTHAGIYGIDMSVNTMSDLYQIPIDYYVKINFSSLEKVVSVLGGVSVYSDQTFSSYKYTYQQGYNELNAEQALEFSRERYTFLDGDRTRGKNQQHVIDGIISKVSSPRTIVNYSKILTALEGTFTTDIPAQTITELIQNQLNSFSKWQTESISVDGTGASEYTYSISDIKLYVMEPDMSTVEAARAKIQVYTAQ